MKNFLVKALVLVLFAGFVACNDDDPTPQGVGEAYVIPNWSLQRKKEEILLLFMVCIWKLLAITEPFHL